MDCLNTNQIAGKALFLGVSERVFSEEIGIPISELNKDDLQQDLPSPNVVGGTT